MIFNNLFSQPTTKAWIGLNRTNKIWTWSDGETWTANNPQFGNIGTFDDPLQAYTCECCQIEATSSISFAGPYYQLCEKKVD